jgi:hypothetical protein
VPARGEDEDDIGAVARSAGRSFDKAISLLPQEFDAAAVEWPGGEGGTSDGGGGGSGSGDGGGDTGGGSRRGRGKNPKVVEEVNFVKCRSLESAVEKRRCAGEHRVGQCTLTPPDP